LRYRLQDMRGLQIPSEYLRKILAVEVLSFGVLSGWAWAVLNFHRFSAAIALFWASSTVLTVGLLLLVFEIKREWLKWFLIVANLLCAIFLVKYFMGIVKQGEDEYRSAQESQIALASKQQAEEWFKQHPNFGKKELTSSDKPPSYKVRKPEVSLCEEVTEEKLALQDLVVDLKKVEPPILSGQWSQQDVAANTYKQLQFNEYVDKQYRPFGERMLSIARKIRNSPKVDEKIKNSITGIAAAASQQANYSSLEVLLERFRKVQDAICK
jgi:hypothetical protein